MGDSEADIIQNFKDVCAVDDATAVEFLSHCEFNLERAVQLFFQTGGTLDNTHEAVQNARNSQTELRRRNVGGTVDGNESSSSSSSASSAQAPRASVPANAAPSAVLPLQMTWMEWLFAVAYLPFRLVLATVADLFGGLSSLFGFSPALPRVVDARGDVHQFVQLYQNAIANLSALPVSFLDMPFSEATQLTLARAEMLLAVFHDSSSAASLSFLRDSLGSQVVGHLLQNSNLLVWGVAKQTAEGARVTYQLKVSTFPLAVLLVPRNGRLVAALRIGNTDAAGLQINLQMSILFHEQNIQEFRQQQRQREEDSRIRAEQESEYQAALTADRARVQEKKRKQEEERVRLARETQRQQELAECAQILSSRREEAAKKRSTSTAVNSPDRIRVQIRFPSGAKCEQSFAPEDSLEELFSTALANPACPDLFSLYTNFPRRELLAAPAWYYEYRHRVLTLQAEAGDEAPPSPSIPSPPRSFQDEGLSRTFVVMAQDDNA